MGSQCISFLHHGVLCFAWNPSLLGDRDSLWGNNLLLERAVVSLIHVSTYCMFMYSIIDFKVWCNFIQFHLLFLLVHNSAVVSRCRSCKVWDSCIETVIFGTNEEFLLARIQILLLLRYSVSIHFSVPDLKFWLIRQHNLNIIRVYKICIA